MIRFVRLIPVLVWILSCAASAEAGEKTATVVLRPRRQAMLSAEVTAAVGKIHKRLGEEFDKGDVLLQLDETEFALAVRHARARLLEAVTRAEAAADLAEKKIAEGRAEAVLKAAQANLSATESLHAGRQTSQVELENARRDVKLAEADLASVRARVTMDLATAQRDAEQARVDLEAAERRLSACTVRAPCAGRVVRVAVHEYERTERGQPLLEIVSDDTLLARFLLPSRLFKTVVKGHRFALSINEINTTVQAELSRVAAVLDAASMTFEVEADVPNPDRQLRAGMTGVVRIREFEPE